jgi:predicted transport protein
VILYYQNSKYQEYQYKSEEEFESEVVHHSKTFFGEQTIFIDSKKKIDSKFIGGSVPDGFLFDLTDAENPEFYLVEVELVNHDFYRHIFPQITKFFAFYKNPKSQADLVEKLFSIINSDSSLKKQFKKFLGEKEIYKFIKDAIENSQNILLIMDDEKDELPEILDTYTDTWGKMVRLLILKKFTNGQDSLYSVNPDFRDIQFTDADSIKRISDTEPTAYTEEYHLDGVSDNVSQIYFYLKEHILKLNANLKFNPQRYYISIIYDRNIAFFKIRKKKIRLVLMLPEEQVKNVIKSHQVVQLSDSVQKFYNGPCCAVNIEKNKNLEEIVNVIDYIIKQSGLNQNKDISVRETT